MEPNILYPIGTICNLIDRDSNDPVDGTMCTIRYIEQDEDGIYYYYLLANNWEKNIYYDIRFGAYFSFVEIDNPFLIALSLPTNV